MKRLLRIMSYALAAAVVVVGVLLAIQLRAPWWQKGIVVLIVLAVAAGLAAVGRTAGARRA